MKECIETLSLIKKRIMSIISNFNDLFFNVNIIRELLLSSIDDIDEVLKTYARGDNDED